MTGDAMYAMKKAAERLPWLSGACNPRNPEESHKTCHGGYERRIKPTGWVPCSCTAVFDGRACHQPAAVSGVGNCGLCKDGSGPCTCSCHTIPAGQGAGVQSPQGTCDEDAETSGQPMAKRSDTLVPLVIEPCLLPGMDETAYHADPVPADIGGSLSVSAVKLLVPPSTPAEFRWAQDHPRVEKKTFKVGHAVHAKVLGVGADVAVIDGNRNANAVKAEIAEAEEEGLIVLKTPEYDEVNAMAEAVLRHPVASVLFKRGHGASEVSAFFRDDVTNVMRRGRFDWLPDEDGGRLIVPDLKTSESVEAGAFGKYAAKYQYPMQGDWYLEALTALGIGNRDNKFVFVVVHKSPPHLVAVYELTEEDRAIGHRLNRNAIDLYAHCMETGEWPGHPEHVTELQLPDWYHRAYAGA